jgi:guanine deaminase
MAGKVFFADVLSFNSDNPDDHDARIIRDALLLVEDGRISALGPASALEASLPEGCEIIRYPGKTLAPGFIDVHLHLPQLDVIASPANGLLPWLENHTFPQEARFAEAQHCQEMSRLFLDEMLRHGVTTGMVFCSSHPQSVDALMAESQRRGVRLVAGKCLMDRHCPDSVRDTTEQSLIDSERLIQRWHGQGRLGYALTPRFAPSCSDAQMRGAAELAERYPGVWVQSHVAENHEEIAWVKALYPKARSYLDVYESFGLLRPRSMYAHCIYLDDTDRRSMQACGASAAVCPTSNLFLGSGLFDFEKADAAGFSYGLASDVGGGTSFSPFRTMLAAFEIARLRGKTLSPSELWYRHTLGAARAMDLADKIGNLAVGMEADFIVLDSPSTPLLERRSSIAESLEDWLFSHIVLADDRAIFECFVAGLHAATSDLKPAVSSPT